jgi:multiple RNA-binding domain-containing protein 1
MRADTVAAAMAAHYGVSKAQLLDASAEDLPLRMALGEAQVRLWGGRWLLRVERGA